MKDLNKMISYLLSKEPSKESAVDAFKAVHNLLGHNYTDELDYSDYILNGDVDRYVKTCYQLAIQVCMTELRCLMTSLPKFMSMKNKDKEDKVSGPIGLFVDLSIITMMRCINGTAKIEISDSIRSSIKNKICEADLELTTLFEVEVNLLRSLGGAMIAACYGEDLVKTFLDLFGEWFDQIGQTFLTTVVIKNSQNK